MVLCKKTGGEIIPLFYSTNGQTQKSKLNSMNLNSILENIRKHQNNPSFCSWFSILYSSTLERGNWMGPIEPRGDILPPGSV